jgi:RHS repeat-associated protein
VKTKLHDGREHLAAYDSLGRLDSTTDAKLQVIRYTYWYETGQTLTLKDAKLQTTTWFYNQLGQLLTKLYPNGDDHAYEYDGHHRMHKHTTPKNEVCTYSYDVRDRQTLADWNTTTPDTAKTWWANGLLKSIDNGVSKSDYAYSVKNQLTSETQTLAGQTAKVVSHTYDADGLRLQMNSPSGSPVDYEWTAKAQLDVISRDGPPPLANYAYDKAGRLDTLTHENGIVQDLTYDAASQLQSRVHKQGGTTTVSGHGYTLDATGRRTAETFPGTSTPARTYGYDTADQVTSANYDGGGTQTDAYAYDPAGNRSTATVIALGGTATTYTANSVNQYTSITGISVPVHDANGNLTFQNGVTYTWDSENRLLSVSDGTTVNTFTYDALHRRVTMRTAVSGTVTNKVHYLYDGWNVIEERTNTDTTPGFALSTFALTKTLTWGTDFSGTLQGAGGVGGLLLITDHSALGTSSYHFQYDGNGNVTEITDHTGASAATYRYDAFGNTLVSTGTYAATNRYRFSTKPLDDEITNAPLYYYAYRYYDPVTGSWPSRDPIEEQGGVNLYGFVGNDGVNRWDRLGLEGEEFRVVGTDVRVEGGDDETATQRAQRRTGNSLGIDHVDLYYGQEKLSALLVQGFAPRADEFPSYDNDLSNQAFSKILDRVTGAESALKWGDYKDKKCDCVTDAMRVNCLLASPAPTAGHCAGSNDCQTDVRYATEGCCLSGYDNNGPFNPDPINYMSDREREIEMGRRRADFNQSFLDYPQIP